MLFAAAIVTGCAAPVSGDLVTQEKVEAIKINVTTLDEMIRQFGPPRSQHVNAQGLQTATWFYFNNSEFGAMQDQRTLTVIYNRDHTVKEYMNSSAGEKASAPGR
ncbi:hypothetical protein KYC_01230 [Achromobacter arsenitoxydans SY8]|uniref:Lipoprotein SmpA/OmlA domain-containing protein n=1 Tax=Achromobacter arsenitoxydans SY8 TaxID=477184 RepID=H0F0E3_9BURK|nr:hypothetical protein KYC_01230 [Achromobacter arsenitoxydans SY8]